MNDRPLIVQIDYIYMQHLQALFTHVKLNTVTGLKYCEYERLIVD